MIRPRLTFFGGVGTSTGANIMLQFNGKTILVDCGLLQGKEYAEHANFDPFEFDPSKIDFLLITHAHLDHIGKVPKLVRDGFKGTIISTTETMELARPLLDDALNVMRSKYKDKTLYEKVDIEKSFSLWQGEKYGEKINLFDGCFLEIQNSGHILGSGILNVECSGVKISFTGDLGNSPSPLLPDTEFPKGSDYIVMESVYGDRNHEKKSDRREKLKNYLIGGIKRGGDIVIPAFSIERTQVLLYEINNMVEAGEIPQVPVFLDSPLAIKVTHIYQKYQKDFKESVQQEIKKGDDIFDFPGLKIVNRVAESNEIENTKGAKIILAGSGMSEGGRVVNHETRILGDEKNTLILVGYQAPGTLGRQLEEGTAEIKISKHGKKERLKVRAKIEVIKGYSSHMDSDHLVEFVERSAATEDGERSRTMRLKKVFVIMGEPKASLFLSQRIREYLDIDAVYPEERKEYEL